MFPVKESMFRIPLFSYLLKQINCIPIDKHNTEKSIQNMNKLKENA
jgi:1-acyl-sn-glycerol-3-phosphate acyltransferase